LGVGSGEHGFKKVFIQDVPLTGLTLTEGNDGIFSSGRYILNLSLRVSHL